MDSNRLGSAPSGATVRALGALALAIALAAGCEGGPTEVTHRGVVSGRVEDSGGTPVLGVDVQVRNIYPATTGFELHVARTDGTGSFRLEGVLAGLQLVATTTSGFAAADTVRVPNTEGGSAPYAVLRLEPEGALRGTVMLEGASDHRGTVISGDLPWTLASTDSTGRYALGGFPAGRWTLRATHFGFVGRAVLGTAISGDTVDLLALELALESGDVP